VLEPEHFPYEENRSGNLLNQIEAFLILTYMNIKI
jgi:hypothetical protein